MHFVLKAVPKILHSVLFVYSHWERKARTNGRGKEMNPFLCENGEKKEIRHFPFPVPYLRTWKFVKCIQ